MAISTVAGRLTIIGDSGVGCQIAETALQTSTAYSSSVPVYDSGEYWKRQSVSGYFSLNRATSSAPVSAILRIPARSDRKTTRRCRIDVELYRCTIARGAPSQASNVRSISSGRAWVSTWIVTSSGMESLVMISRTKSKSVWLADGNPTSISL